MKKRRVKTAFFDLDGTLIDSKKDIIDSLNYALKSLGYEEKPEEVIRGYIGPGRDMLILDSLGRAAPPDVVTRAGKIFSEHYHAHMFDNTNLFPGVPDVLEYLKSKTLMIVTNKARDLTIQTLKRFGIEKYFRKVVGGDDEMCRKPNACPIVNLLGEIYAPREEAIMIGDSDIDVQSGKLAGILTCGLTCGIGREEDIKKAGPDYILDDIRKLKDIIY